MTGFEPWGEPEDSSLRDQYVAEIFYRIQVTPSISFTPSLQMILDPSIALNEDVVGVFSMRARVAF